MIKYFTANKEAKRAFNNSNYRARKALTLLKQIRICQLEDGKYYIACRIITADGEHILIPKTVF